MASIHNHHVMLLTDICEQFRATCHETYGLDPAHYYTLPGYTWDAMLKHTKSSLETIQDVDILLFFESGVRGGLSQCSNRYSIANNKYVPGYNSEAPSKYLMYFDVNNLYGWVMSQYLPFGGFEWLTDLEDFNVFNVADNSDIGYILEVDLYYPEHLHNLHRDLPFCPEHRKPPNSKLPKLMATLYLKQCLKHGVVLEKIHKILKFNQSARLEPYVTLNSNLRAQADSEFGKTTYKMCVNAIYGKTMQNIRKHRIIKLINTWAGRSAIFDEDVVAIELNKTHLVFNKPLYIDACKLLYTDTDSLLYEIKCEDAYQEVIGNEIARFDTSDYAPDNSYDLPRVNKKIKFYMSTHKTELSLHNSLSGHFDVNSLEIDCHGDKSAFVELRRGFSNHDAKSDTPYQKEDLD
ncbi:hypothetical protein NQ315_014656 [Exocentrus adspersus]|uniref:DNA-directed DNA polymerase n=1 Tax=Exocentrus adspersus TaxID=1586481 RepID=A0AAV8VPZ7_9CUCU|nr:hypothetical protein NQ315_014656 [Exocentrus adspersus]